MASGLKYNPSDNEITTTKIGRSDNDVNIDFGTNHYILLVEWGNELSRHIAEDDCPVAAFGYCGKFVLHRPAGRCYIICSIYQYFY